MKHRNLKLSHVSVSDTRLTRTLIGHRAMSDLVKLKIVLGPCTLRKENSKDCMSDPLELCFA